MSDTTLQQLVANTFEAVSEVRKVNSMNVRAIPNLQEACTGLAALIQNHTAALRAHQAAIDSLLKATGVDFRSPDDSAAPDAIN